LNISKSEFGLTNKSNGNARCTHCDLPLHCSTWKDVKVFFSLNRTLVNGFYCVRCATSRGPPGRRRKQNITIEELDKYVEALT
jgi:hypothetical protein